METKNEKKVDAVFFDVDGTLYDHDRGCIPPLHLEAMKKLQDQGIRVCLCSGRCQPLLENLGILDMFDFDGIVAGNGSYVYGKNGEILFSDPVDPEVSDRIFAMAKEQGLPIFAAGNHVLVTKVDDAVRDLFPRISVHDIPVRDPQPEDTFAVYSIVELPRKPHPEFDLPGVKLLPNELSLDMMKDGLSKYEGIRTYLDHYGLHSYMAFGDAWNDLEMLANADVGVAMGDGQKELLDRIPETCPPASESGIHTWLQENGWIS